MRKLVILGLCALIFEFFTHSAFAGNVEECEQLKGGTPGLYGLCIAYANAGNDRARDRIASNYARKMKPGDPTLDEIFNDGPTCPCWDEVRLLADACALDVTGTSSTSVQLGGGVIQYFNFGSQCVYSNFGTSEVIGLPTDVDEAAACQAGMDMLVSGELLAYCP